MRVGVLCVRASRVARGLVLSVACPERSVVVSDAPRVAPFGFLFVHWALPSFGLSVAIGFDCVLLVLVALRPCFAIDLRWRLCGVVRAVDGDGGDTVTRRRLVPSPCAPPHIYMP